MATAPALDLDEEWDAFPRRYPMLVEQLEAMIDAGVLGDARVELIDGELIEMAPQYLPHMWVKTQIGARLARALDAIGSPLVVTAEGTFKIGDRNAPQPDVIVWQRVRLPKLLPSAQVRLAVEVCATSHAMDFGRKPRLYAGAGVPEYWVADLAAWFIQRMTRPEDGSYRDVLTVPFGELLASPTLGVQIATDDFD